MHWMEQQSLPTGILSHNFSDEETGEQLAVFDLACPNGIQEELSEPAVVLLNEPAENISIANKSGFRCFTSSLCHGFLYPPGTLVCWRPSCCVRPSMSKTRS